MREKITIFVSKIAEILEFIITMVLSVGIMLMCAQLVGALLQIPGSESFPEYQNLLKICFNLIIGVEMIRMLYYHTADIVFEVLVFAIARQIIIDHSSALSNLLGVVAIAVLFATKKFLYTRSEDFMRVEESLAEIIGNTEEPEKEAEEEEEKKETEEQESDGEL